MSKVPTALEGMKQADLQRLLAALKVAVEELGPNTPPRQIMALLLVALHNKSGKAIGVSDVDEELGDLKSGSASKLLRSMMHVETERKPGVANTIRSERDAKDLRRWDLYVTLKGAEALSRIVQAFTGEKG